jgi:hypothetical protein
MRKESKVRHVMVFDATHIADYDIHGEEGLLEVVPITLLSYKCGNSFAGAMGTGLEPPP